MARACAAWLVPVQLIAFYMARQRAGPRIDVGEEVELTAMPNQKIVSLAGAIAGKVCAAAAAAAADCHVLSHGMCMQVRELKRVHLVAVGPDAVTSAVLAIGNARLFLENDKMDIKVGGGGIDKHRLGNGLTGARLGLAGPQRKRGHAVGWPAKVRYAGRGGQGPEGCSFMLTRRCCACSSSVLQRGQCQQRWLLLRLSSCACCAQQLHLWQQLPPVVHPTLLHLQITPEFVKLEKNRQQMNGLRFNIVPERI